MSCATTCETHNVERCGACGWRPGQGDAAIHQRATELSEMNHGALALLACGIEIERDELLRGITQIRADLIATMQREITDLVEKRKRLDAQIERMTLDLSKYREASLRSPNGHLCS